jgi:hypothetical protein
VYCQWIAGGGLHLAVDFPHRHSDSQGLESSCALPACTPSSLPVLRITLRLIVSVNIRF